MRKLVEVAAAGAINLAGVILAPEATAQGYGANPPTPTGYVDSYGEYHQYAPPPTAYTPAPDYTYSNGYYDAPIAVGSTWGRTSAAYSNIGTPYDDLGPDPNGLIAPDGHRIKCKSRTSWSDWRGAYVTRRVCR